jgi:2-hydroxy-3-oxopropionate reductase
MSKMANEREKSKGTMKEKMKVGFIGLGIMGRPMAENLLKAGYELTVYGHHADVNQELEKHGAVVASCGREVAKQSEVVITMVQNSPQVREAVFGKNGLAEGFQAGKSVLIDMSSIDPVESRKIAEQLEKQGVDMMDCPVSGGEPKAIDGTLSVMCGGKKETFDRYYDLLMAMAGSVVYVGAIGSGNVAKLANQMIVASNIGIVAEALTFAKKAGTDPELVYQAIRGGLAGSTVLDAKAPMMLSGNYKPGFRIDLHIKDLANALNASHAINMPVPMTAQMMEVMQELKNHGEGECDHNDIVRFYERMTGVSIAKKDGEK